MADGHRIVETVEEAADLQAVMAQIRARCGVHAVYQLAQRPDTGLDFTYVRTSFPPGWVGEYITNELIEIDPIMHASFSRSEPFDWRDVPMDRPKRLVETAHRYGVGPWGYCWPMVERNGRRGAFSINSDVETEADWDAILAGHQAGLGFIAHAVHARALREVYGDEPALTERELECIHWTAAGKSAAEVAAILSISQHTVRQHLKNARARMDASSLQHLINMVLKSRLLPPPLT